MLDLEPGHPHLAICVSAILKIEEKFAVTNPSGVQKRFVTAKGCYSVGESDQARRFLE